MGEDRPEPRSNDNTSPHETYFPAVLSLDLDELLQ